MLLANWEYGIEVLATLYRLSAWERSIPEYVAFASEGERGGEKVEVELMITSGAYRTAAMAKAAEVDAQASVPGHELLMG